MHVPWIDPGGATQGSPAQQSALVVHDRPLVWQEVGLHWSWPLAPGTHGLPLQHSFAAEQSCPEARHEAPPSGEVEYPLQRGMPKPSRMHMSALGVSGPQQSDRFVEFPQV